MISDKRLNQIKAQIETANALGRSNLAEKGVALPEGATTYEIMERIADVSAGGGEFKSYADKIYEYYGLDKAAYPYLTVGILAEGRTRIYCSAEPLNTTDSKAYSHYTVSRTTGLVGETDVGVVFGWLKGAIQSIASLTNAQYYLPEGTFFANYPIEETETVKYYPL